MTSRKPAQEDVEHMALTCRTCAVAMLTIGAMHVTWAKSGTEEGRAHARESILEVLANHLGDEGMAEDAVASVRRVYEAEDAREGTPEERYNSRVTDILIDAMAACILTAFDDVLIGIKGRGDE